MSSARHRSLAALVHPLLALLLLLAPAAYAAAPSPLAALAAPAPAKPAAPTLSPIETKQVLDLLNDPQKRAAFTATLETLTKANAVVNPAKPANPAPLAPDSVGAQVIKEGTTWIAGLSGQISSFGRLLGDLPGVWVFTLRTFEDPARRAFVLDASWRLAVVLLSAGLVEAGLWWLLRRPKRAIARAVPDPIQAEPARPVRTLSEARVEAAARAADSPEPEADEAAAAAPISEQEEAAVERVLRGRRFARTVRTMKRLPFVGLCLVLDLLPLAGFIGVGYAGTLFATIHSAAVLQAAVLAYAICSLAVILTRMVVQPSYPSLRLAHVSDSGAAYVVNWARWIFAIGAFGYAASQIGQLFGMPDDAKQAFLKAVALVFHACLVVVVLQCRASIAARIRSNGPRTSVTAKARNRLASIWHLVAIFYIVALWLVWAAEVRNGYVRIWHVFLVTIGIVLVARLLNIIAVGGLDRLFRVGADPHLHIAKRTDRYYPMLRRAISTLLIVLTSLVLLQAWGFNIVLWFRHNALGGKLASATLTILVAAAAAFAVWETVNASMDNHLAYLTKQSQYLKSARLRTLLPILRTVLFTCLLIVFALTALSEIGVNIAPLLAGAGILGVAIGFGSQKLVQDFITGIFLLLENAMQVGDWVTVAGLSGSVENLSIRTMRLRAGDGSVHIIPFSSVSTVTNVNRGIGNAAVTVSIPLEEDSDHVSELLSDIACKMRGESRFADMMRSDLQLWGVDKVENSVVTIAGQIVCTDAGRWAVQREFNRRMAIRFKELGLRIATPVQTVYSHRVAEALPALTQDVHDAPTGQVLESPPPAALGNTS